VDNPTVRRDRQRIFPLCPLSRRQMQMRHMLAELANLNWPSLESELTAIAERTAQTLRVERVSIWRYDDTRAAMCCVLLWDDGLQPLPSTELSAKDTPKYWAAFHDQRSLVITDAHTHPALDELRTHYIEPLRIGALLDSGIRARGHALGIVCVEQRDVPRAWTLEEQYFVASVADRVGLAFVLDAERRLTEQLQTAQRMESLGMLAGGVAHDFNNILSIILANTEVALDGVARGDQVGDELMAILDTTRRAMSLTRKLLAVARRDVVRPQRVDISEAIRAFYPMAQRIAAPGVSVQCVLTELPMAVSIDATFLDQLLLNLVTNAIQAMPDGGTVTIESGLVVSPGSTASLSTAPHATLPEGQFARLTVRDTGVGIPRSLLSRVFEPFFSTKGERGTGLGLSMVYGGVRQHGGHITVESEPGVSTVFDVYLPLLAA
jgi:two-component system, cell cycle sensor histidine kinase and response regulator CckA